MDKRQLRCCDLLFKVQVCWPLHGGSGGHWSYMQGGLPERYLPPTGTHWHQWPSQWLLSSCSLVFPKISMLVFSFLNPCLVNDPIFGNPTRTSSITFHTTLGMFPQLCQQTGPRSASSVPSGPPAMVWWEAHPKIVEREFHRWPSHYSGPICLYYSHLQTKRYCV